MINIDKGSVKFGTSFVEGVKQTLGQTYEAVKEAVPVVGQVEEFYANSEERAKARLLERGFTPEQIQTADAEKQQYTKTGEATSQFLDTVSDVTNIDRDLIGVGAVALESLVEPGFGASVAFKRGAAALEMRDVTRLQKTVAAAADPAQNYYLTVTDPRFIAKGITEGVAEQPQFAAALTRRDDALTKVRANIARREAQGKPATKYKKELAGKGSTLDYDPDDPIVFEKARYRVYDPLDPERTAHQHHLFAKAQSYPFVEKMEELISLGKADRDDLVNMFAFADMLDVTMGNTRKNMLDAPGRAHIDAAPGSTQFDKSRNIHTLLKEFDLEIPGNQVRKIVADADNATELMKRFNDYILESVKPQKVVAQRIVEDFLERHKRSLPKDQLPMFNDLVSKLGGRIKR